MKYLKSVNKDEKFIGFVSVEIKIGSDERYDSERHRTKKAEKMLEEKCKLMNVVPFGTVIKDGAWSTLKK